jgi:anoctamin-10
VKQTFLPTILLTVFMPMLSTVLTNLAEKLTDYENYETQDGKYKVGTDTMIRMLNP